MFLPYIRTHLSQIQFHNHTIRIAACSEELISKSMSSNLRPVAAIPDRSQLSNYPPPQCRRNFHERFKYATLTGCVIEFTQPENSSLTPAALSMTRTALNPR